MKHSTRTVKLLTSVFVSIAIACGAFFLKTTLNDFHSTNKNYLATSIRKKPITFQDLTVISIDQALNLDEFIQQSLEKFKKLETPSEPRVFYLTDLSKYTDQPADKTDKGTLVSVRLLISNQQQILLIKRAYSLQSQEVPDHFFEKNPTIDVNLQTKHLLYDLTIDQQNSSPNTWINYLPSYTHSIEKTFDIPSVISDVTIQTQHSKYKYFSNLPMYLVELKSLT